MSNQKLSADPNALILGIVSILLVFGVCCCGLAAIPALGMAIYGLVLANKSLKEYAKYPESFERQSVGNVKSARIVNIVALILSSAVTLMYLAYLLFFGTMLTDGFLNGIKNANFEDDYILEEYDDSLDVWDYEEEVQPLIRDSIVLDSIVPLEE